ncbi:Two component regulator propeller [Planctomycetes bacterium Poly30]|uniref:Two component regulator propeller n=1 Tax=Saltatorellus ferox TaxID=2528018 RepID=A0A518F155_9BACT|nr:Two component regulator propeller [Planctomycetes bacterium Poly30]
MNLSLLVLSMVAALPAFAGQTALGPLLSGPAGSPLEGGEAVSELDHRIWIVFQAEDSSYWFGSDGEGVYRYDGKTLVQFTTEQGLTSNRIRGIQEDRSGSLYVCTEPGGVSRFNGREFSELTALEPAESEWKLGPDDLCFPAGQDSGGVYRWDGTSLHRLTFPPTAAGDAYNAANPRSKSPNINYSPYDVYTTFKDSQGNLWFGTAMLGACCYDGSTFAWAGTGENGSFGVRALAEDKDGKFWLSNCVNRFAKGPANPLAGEPADFRKEPGIATNADPYSVFMSTTRDKDGALWMATLSGGVFRYDGETWTHFPVTHEGKPIWIYSIYRDRQDRLWLGTQEHGVYRLDGAEFERVRI